MNDTKNRIKGYALAALAAAAYGLNPYFGVQLYAENMNLDSILFWRYLIAVPILAIIFATKKINFIPKKKEIFPLAIMGILIAISSLTLFGSYKFMSVGIASTILFMYPLMVAVIMAVCYRERLGLIKYIAMLVALLGICMLSNVNEGEVFSIIGLLLSLGSALSYAIYIVCVNHKSLKHLSAEMVIFWVLITGIIIFLARILISEGMTTPTSINGWGCVLGLSIFPTIISFVFTTKAIHYIGSTPTAILGALEPVTAVIIGIYAFNESLTTLQFIGIILVILAVSTVVAYKK